MNSSRQKLIEELSLYLREREDVMIYGAGIVGRRLMKAIKSLNLDAHISGFVVTKIGQDERVLGKKVYELQELTDKKQNILLAVSDSFQNEILFSLKQGGYQNIKNGYLFSYICEENIPQEMPMEVPSTIDIKLDELMLMQFDEDGMFTRYDIVKECINSDIYSSDSDCYCNHVIEVDSKIRIIDEPQSIAYFMSSNVKDVRIHQNFDKEAVIADEKWLNENVSEQEQESIRGRLSELKSKWMRLMYAIIWPPAYSIRDDILSSLHTLSEIKGYCDIRMDSQEFIEFVKNVYSLDDVEEWQVNAKIKRMKEEREFSVRVASLLIDRPSFRIKRYGHTISDTGIQIKEKIRDQFKDQIDMYVKDVILHTTDNFSQAELLEEIIREKNPILLKELKND